MPDGVVLARLRERGLRGADPRLVYLQWAAEALDEEGNELRPEHVPRGGARFLRSGVAFCDPVSPSHSAQPFGTRLERSEVPLQLVSPPVQDGFL